MYITTRIGIGDFQRWLETGGRTTILLIDRRSLIAVCQDRGILIAWFWR